MAIKQWVSSVLSRRSRRPTQTDEVSRQHVAEVAAQLEAWANQRTLIWVSPPFEKRYYQSMVLDVDASSGLFLTDELFPYEGSADLLVNQQLSVEVREKANHANFKCQCVNVRRSEAERGEPAEAGSPLVMRLPEAISQHQRRAGFRVDLNHIQEAYVRFRLPDMDADAMFPLLDISSVGVAISVPAPMAETFPERVEGVLVTVLDVMFEVALVRRRTYLLPDGRYLVGLAFSDLLPSQQMKLERWILQLQRKLRRQARNQYAA